VIAGSARHVPTRDIRDVRLWNYSRRSANVKASGNRFLVLFVSRSNCPDSKPSLTMQWHKIEADLSSISVAHSLSLRSISRYPNTDHPNR
jgi:hypothetical protein